MFLDFINGSNNEWILVVVWAGFGFGLCGTSVRIGIRGSPVRTLEPTLQGIPVSLIDEAIAVRSLSLDQRLDRVSNLLLQRPYKVDAIGEGKRQIVIPFFDTTFDCLTFVEEVLALTLPYDPGCRRSDNVYVWSGWWNRLRQSQPLHVATVDPQWHCEGILVMSHPI